MLNAFWLITFDFWVMSIVLFTSSLFKEMKSGFVGDNQITDLSCLADLELNGCLRKDQVRASFPDTLGQQRIV